MEYFFTIDQSDYKSWCLSHDLPSYTLSQVHEWIIKKNTINFDLMTNISKKNRDKLKETLIIDPFESIEICPASDNSATKYIFQIQPHVFIEAVAIQEKGYETFSTL